MSPHAFRVSRGPAHPRKQVTGVYARFLLRHSGRDTDIRHRTSNRSPQFAGVRTKVRVSARRTKPRALPGPPKRGLSSALRQALHRSPSKIAQNMNPTPALRFPDGLSGTDTLVPAGSGSHSPLVTRC